MTEMTDPPPTAEEIAGFEYAEAVMEAVEHPESTLSDPTLSATPDSAESDTLVPKPDANSAAGEDA